MRSSSLLFTACALAVAPGLGAQLLLKDAYPGFGSSAARSFVNVEGRGFFVARGHPRYTFLWQSDGTPASTRQVAFGGLVQALSGPSVVGRRVLMASDLGLYGTDGTAAGTGFVAPLAVRNQPGYLVGSILDIDGVGLGLLRGPANDYALFRTDGTAAGTRTVRTFTGYVVGQLPRQAGRRVYFVLDTGSQSELWASDGTGVGTVRVWTAGGMPSQISLLASAGGRVFFWVSPNRLHSSDGTIAGTAPVTAFGTRTVESLDRFGDDALAMAVTGAGTIELWRLDVASMVGTRLVGLVANRRPQDYYVVRSAGEVAYVYNLRSLPSDTWITDGTAAGTVRFLQPGDGVTVQSVHPIGEQIVFAGTTAADGTEPWISDGTRAGTRMLVDLVPGVGSSYANQFTLWSDLQAGPSLVFGASDPTHGYEARILGMAAVGIAAAVPVRPGCAGTGSAPDMVARGGTPRLGSTTFGLELRSGRPNALTGFFFDVRIGADVGGCASLLPAALMVLGTTDARGEARLPIPVPNVPALVGSAVFAQSLVATPGGPVLGIADASPVVAIVPGR